MSNLYKSENIALLEQNGFTKSEWTPGGTLYGYSTQQWLVYGEPYGEMCHILSSSGTKTFPNFEELFTYLENEVFEYTSSNPKYDKPPKYPRG